MPIENDLQSKLPLTEATFLILLSLVNAPKHGYSIMKEVEILSEQRVSLSTGTLYGVLKRLLEQGWINRVEAENANNSNREIKEYALSDEGRRMLKMEAERMQRLLQQGASLLAGGQL